MSWSKTPVMQVQFGRECRCGSTSLPRHRHSTAYLSLILKGGHEEAGDRGRLRVFEGLVIVHAPFEAHRNCYSVRGAEVLNLALDMSFEPTCAVMSVSDPDAIVRVAEKDSKEAAILALSTAKQVPLKPQDWPDELAAAILRDPRIRLGEWAQEYGLAEATVTRGFRKVFGIAPSGYRAQVRTRSALRRILHRPDSLADIALQSGFCDQAHLTHAIVGMTGCTPGAWRRRCQIDTRPSMT